MSNIKLTKEQEIMMDAFEKHIQANPTPKAVTQATVEEIVAEMTIEALLFELDVAKKEANTYRGSQDGSMRACYVSYCGPEIEAELERRGVPFTKQSFN
jgi:hypothetical protein